MFPNSTAAFYEALGLLQGHNLMVGIPLCWPLVAQRREQAVPLSINFGKNLSFLRPSLSGTPCVLTLLEIAFFLEIPVGMVECALCMSRRVMHKRQQMFCIFHVS